MESRFRMVFGHIRRAALLKAPDLAILDDVLGTLVRVRDSFSPELLILLLLIIHTATSFRGLLDATPWLTHGALGDLHLTAAGWYTIVVTAPIFQFLLGRALWKWLLWTFFVFQLSRGICNWFLPIRTGTEDSVSWV